jgi:hypothetical protein
LKLDALRQHIGTVNGQFYYTLGSTWYLAGDLAQAVLALRRAEQLLPGNVDVIANLAQARADRPDQLPDSFIPPWLTILGIPTLPNWFLRVIFMSGWLMFWLGRFKQVKSSNVLTSHFSLVALGIILLSGGTILARQIAHYYHSDGVVTSNQVIARKGDALLYQPAFTNPLTAGTEVRICEKRPGWIQVQLSNGSRCWLPELAVTRIDH